uniref:Uncharacterized protein n=1 Tax=Arundo donax TaxID=35708 RepID=A0A0A9AHQ1_ARUDO
MESRVCTERKKYAPILPRSRKRACRSR